MNYAIIKHNYPELERETVLTHNKYNAKKKYALIVKGIHKDSSESIFFIDYSNDLEELHNRAITFESWYNYPLGVSKCILGIFRAIR
jgi:hypothetical protein